MGILKGVVVIVGLVAAFALWSFPVSTVFTLSAQAPGVYDAIQRLSFVLHVGAVLCLVVALFCAANLVLRSLERTRAPHA